MSFLIYSFMPGKNAVMVNYNVYIVTVYQEVRSCMPQYKLDFYKYYLNIKVYTYYLKEKSDSTF